MPPKTLLKAGVAAILLALAVYWVSERWLETRTFEPVNIPVTL
jgi:hypothetical protein